MFYAFALAALAFSLFARCGCLLGVYEILRFSAQMFIYRFLCVVVANAGGGVLKLVLFASGVLFAEILNTK